MSFTIQDSIASFLLACLVYWLFDHVIDTFVTKPEAKKIFSLLLLIICLVIALAGSLFIKL